MIKFATGALTGTIVGVLGTLGYFVALTLFDDEHGNP